MLAVNETVDPISGGEAVLVCGSMLFDTAFQVIRDSAIKSSRSACEDVHHE